MKCNNCNIIISNKFIFSIRNNQCPACGKSIMHPEQIASFISLKQLLSNNFGDLDAEIAANLIVANFELKQLFKEDSSNKPIASREISDVEVSEDITDAESDEIHKVDQMAKAKEKLKEMKQEAYEDALKDQYGMNEDEVNEDDVTGSSSFFSEDGLNTIELADRMEKTQKQSDSKKGMMTGTGGFSRTNA